MLVWLLRPWTDLDNTGVQEAAETAGAAALGSLAQLLHASTVVRALLVRAAQVREQAARQSPCEEDNRAACAAESDAGTASGASTERAGPASRSAGRRRRAVAVLATLIAETVNPTLAPTVDEEVGSE